MGRYQKYIIKFTSKVLGIKMKIKKRLLIGLGAAFTTIALGAAIGFGVGFASHSRESQDLQLVVTITTNMIQQPQLKMLEKF